MIGQFQTLTLNFVKKYGKVAEMIIGAAKACCEEVRPGEISGR